MAIHHPLKFILLALLSFLAFSHGVYCQGEENASQAPADEVEVAGGDVGEVAGGDVGEVAGDEEGASDDVEEGAAVEDVAADNSGEIADANEESTQDDVTTIETGEDIETVEDEPPLTGISNIYPAFVQAWNEGSADALNFVSDDTVYRLDSPSAFPIPEETVGKEAYIAMVMEIQAVFTNVHYEILSLTEFVGEDGAESALVHLTVSFTYVPTDSNCELETFGTITLTPDGTQIALQSYKYSSQADFGFLHSSEEQDAKLTLRKFISSGGSYRYLASDVSFRRGFSVIAGGADPENSSSLEEHRAYEEALKDSLSVGEVKIQSISGGSSAATADISFKTKTSSGKSTKSRGTLYVETNDDGLINLVRYAPADWDEFLLGPPLRHSDKKKSSKKRK